MGEIKVGDKVFTGQGNVAEVLGVFPQGLRLIYEITLADGRKIRVADNHLNPVLIEVNSYGDKPTHCLPYVNMETIHLKHAIDRWNISAYTIPAFDDDSLMADRLITSCELIGKDYQSYQTRAQELYLKAGQVRLQYRKLLLKDFS